MPPTSEVIKIGHDENPVLGGDGGDDRRRGKHFRRADDAETQRANNELLRLHLAAQKQRVWIALWTLILTAIMAITGQLPQIMEHLVNRVAVEKQLQPSKPTEH